MPIAQATDLFAPVTVGALTLKNRIVMAPMTRGRNGEDGVPGPINAKYYAQRASAGLIVTESVSISPQGQHSYFAPGIFTDAQVAGWRKVTDAVHTAGGLIACQLMHSGRISHASLQPGGAQPVAPSAVRPNVVSPAGEPYAEPRALETAEIQDVIEQFRRATLYARAAGFDAVEILAGGGYLVEQFLKDKTNRRTDRYGGSIPNRVRFLTEVVGAVVGSWSADRVGIRFSPTGVVNDISESDPEPLFRTIFEQIGHIGLAYLHMLEGVAPGERVAGIDLQALRSLFDGPYIANNAYDLDLALAARRTGAADLVSFGKAFISNPDLVDRLRTGAPLASPDPSTFFASEGPQGYVDYPALMEHVL